MSSVLPTFNPFYEPVATERYFTRQRKYDEVERDRNDLGKMADAFEERIRNWYVEPIEVLLETRMSDWRKRLCRWLVRRQDGGHYSFTIAAMTCLLIDALSQFEAGLAEGTNGSFKAFVKQHLPSYGASLTPAIDGYRPPSKCQPLSNLADVLYHGFRCGILHQAHAPLYCGIVPGKSPPRVEYTRHAKYAAGAVNSTVGSDCPVVVLYPEHLFDEVMAFFSSYLKNIKDKNPAYDAVRDKFKWKFSDSFGIDITAAVLT